MGLKERHERNREAVRRAILATARDLFVSEGYLNVSMRKIAERIEYSPAAIYSYFPSKADIFFALAEEGFKLLFSEKRVSHSDDPLECVRSVFWHFYEFSKRHPEHFTLMFVDTSVPRISKDWERFGFVREMRGQLSKKIADAVTMGLLPAGTNPDSAFRILATAVYGAAVFRLCRIQPTEDADALARDVLEATLTGLRAGSPITFTSACPELLAGADAAEQIEESPIYK